MAENALISDAVSHQARNQLSPQGGSFSTNIIPSKNFLLQAWM